MIKHVVTKNDGTVIIRYMSGKVRKCTYSKVPESALNFMSSKNVMICEKESSTAYVRIKK